MNEYDKMRIGIGLAAGGLGLAAGAASVALCAARPPKRDVSPSPEDPDAEPWELEAALVAPVGGEVLDDPDEVPDEPAVGSGSPDDLCFSGERIGNPEPTYCILDPLSVPELRPVDRGAPQAPVPPSSRWPVKTRAPGRLVTSYLSESGWRGYSGRAFGALRERDDGPDARHAGVDLFAAEGDLVVAPEDGRVIAVLPFYHGAWAVYLRTADDRVLNLGEVAPKSHREFGVRPGAVVKAGDPMARIGRMHNSSMLHFETYDASGLSDEEMVEMIRTGQMQWNDEAPPARVRDPSSYLLVAGARQWRSGRSPDA